VAYNMPPVYWATSKRGTGERRLFTQRTSPARLISGEADRYLMRVVRFFDGLATEQPERARAEIGLWPENGEFFFDKLKIYVLMNARLFPGHECAEGILALSDRAFWDNYLRRELLHTLRAEERGVRTPEGERNAPGQGCIPSRLSRAPHRDNSRRRTTTATAIAKKLNDRGTPTSRDGRWQAVQVQRLLRAAREGSGC
jgi:hypothetical protein